MTVGIEQAAVNLTVALCLGAAIGFERQWRHRLAGLRTNTLAALGAASFVLFSTLAPGDGSPARVAAQVVSGIGFLGAGVIFKEGLSVRGLNTAAVEVTAKLTSEKRREPAVETIVGRLSLESAVTAARWRTETTLV